jgi:hypothetical protein
MSDEALLIALAQAIPGFSEKYTAVPAVDGRQGEYKQLYWLDALLGERYLCYVEWKEWIKCIGTGSAGRYYLVYRQSL